MKNEYRDNSNEPDFQFELDQKGPKEKKKGVIGILMLSGLFHGALLLALLLIVVATSNKSKEDIIFTTELMEEYEEPVVVEEKREVIKEKVDLIVVTDLKVEPIVTNEETSDHNETENNMEIANAEGVSEGISDSPQVGSGLNGNIGGGGGGGGAFGNRTGGGKKAAILKGGGSQKTESSVDAALAWLMRHQEADGHWDGVKYGNSGVYGKDGDMTGLAVLAFLAAGHTPKNGKYKKTVKIGLEWLVSKQNADGSFLTPGHTHTIYQNSICALTLAEAFSMHPDHKLKVAAQKAIDYIANARKGEVLHHGVVENGSPHSIGVMGWMMMALKSAKIAGLKVPEDIFDRYKVRLDQVTSKSAYGKAKECAYDHEGKCLHTGVMDSVAMLMYEYMGVQRVELDDIAETVSIHLPSVDKFDLYRWYYTTLALFQHGGEKWKRWNKALVEVLTSTQCKGGPLDGSLQDIDGSWEPSIDQWGDGKGHPHAKQGRVYTTAMGAFCLEVYYRYASVYR